MKIKTILIRKRQYMISPSNEYCGDEAMREFLKKASSQLTLYEIYGLFYGCLAATNMVKPSQYMPMIFGVEGASFDSEEEANVFFGNLMFLWNTLSHLSKAIYGTPHYIELFEIEQGEAAEEKDIEETLNNLN